MAVTINGSGAVSGLGDITYGSANPVISGSSLASLKITSPNGESRYFFGELGNTVSSQMSFYDSTGAQKIRIAAGDGDTFFNAANVLIGRTSTIDGNSNSSTGTHINSNGLFQCAVNGDTCLALQRLNSNGSIMQFRRDTTFVGAIEVTTSSTSYATSSDYRLKENVTAISDGITRLKTLKPSRFNFKVDPDKTVDGFLAHEVTAVPEAISGTKDEVDSNGDPVYQGIDQSKLVPLLTAALQEAVGKIETLETKVAALEAA